MAAAQCRSSKCTAERKGFRRELDSWRHKLIHCVGFESILEGVYGSLLLKDLNIFDDCEPDDVDDWSVDASCSFCNLQLDKLNDHVPAAASPLSSPSDDTPSQAPPLSDSCQSAHRFLHAVFHRKDDPASCEPSIPLAAQQLMTKMILQFAKEYAGKNGFSTGTDPESPLLDCPDPDAPLDLTVTRNQENHVREPKPDGVLDLSKRNSAGSATSSPTNHKASGRQHRARQREEYAERSCELSEGLLSKALRDVRSGSLEERRAALLYGIPPTTLRQSLEALAEGGVSLLRCLAQGGGAGAVREEVAVSQDVLPSVHGGEARLVLQRLAAWAERAELGGEAVWAENGEIRFPSSSSSSSCHHQRSLQRALSLSLPHQLRDDPPGSPPPQPSLDPPTPLRIPQVRSVSTPSRPTPLEPYSLAETLYHHTSTPEGTTPATTTTAAAARSSALFKLRSPLLLPCIPSLDACLGGADLSPHRLGLARRSSSLEDSEEGGAATCRDRDKQPRKKRGRYRQYDHDLLEEAITMVMGSRMSVSKAQSVYGIPHSTLEYKVKERLGKLKIPPKKKPPGNSRPTDSSGSGTVVVGSADSGTTAAANRF